MAATAPAVVAGMAALARGRGLFGVGAFLTAPLDAKAAAVATAVSCFALRAFDAASPTSFKCARHGSKSGLVLKLMSYKLSHGRRYSK
jgi:hypothetical protein